MKEERKGELKGNKMRREGERGGGRTKEEEKGKASLTISSINHEFI